MWPSRLATANRAMDTPQAVSERSSLHPEPPRDPIEIGTGQAHTSRIYDYLLGGNDNFAVDREAAEHAFAAYPGGVDGARSDARANRAFLGRTVRFLAGAGIRQFLDIGTGIPNDDNVHAVLAEVKPDARVVYVDNDPIVLAHAHALLAGSDRAAYVDGDLCEPGPILREAAYTLDFGEPIAVLLFGILHVVPDALDPYEAVATFVRPLVPGSYLAISHMTTDVQPDAMAKVVERLDETTGATNPPAFRSKDDVSRFFAGLDLVDPGMVQIDLWRPDPQSGSSRPGARVPPLYAGVGRKP
jgi:S-adenosyl methyltransferase